MTYQPRRDIVSKQVSFPDTRVPRWSLGKTGNQGSMAQTTYNKVTWEDETTANVDCTVDFTNNRVTPPSGTYDIGYSLGFTVGGGNTGTIHLYKNGSSVDTIEHALADGQNAGGIFQGVSSNGADYWEIFEYHGVAFTTGIYAAEVSGDTQAAIFTGIRVGDE